MSKRSFLPWSIAAFGVISAAGCERISSHRVEAIAADARNAQRNDGRTLLAGENIAAGTSIQTTVNGRADLILLPNTLLRLEENGELQVADLKFCGDGNETSGGVRERAATVRVRSGRLIARLEQHGYNTASLLFHTARGQIRADGNALFEINEEPDATSAICVRGHLDISPAAAHHISTIWPGDIMRMDNSGSKHVPLTPADRAGAKERCAKAEVALQYEANAQKEARR